MDINIHTQLYHIQKRDFFFHWPNLPPKPPTPTQLSWAAKKLNLSIDDIHITPGLNGLFVFKCSMNSMN